MFQINKCPSGSSVQAAYSISPASYEEFCRWYDPGKV